LLKELIVLPAASQGCQKTEAKGTNMLAKKQQVMKRLTFVCLGLFLITAAAPEAFAWRATGGARGGAAVRGPNGGTAYRGHAVVRPGARVAAGVAVGAAAGAAHAANSPYYSPPHY
jgi:hypothetical protein